MSRTTPSAIDEKGSPVPAKCCRRRSATTGSGGSGGIPSRAGGEAFEGSVSIGLVASLVTVPLFCEDRFAGVSDSIGLFQWTDFDCRSKVTLAAIETGFSMLLLLTERTNLCARSVHRRDRERHSEFGQESQAQHRHFPVQLAFLSPRARVFELSQRQ